MCCSECRGQVHGGHLPRTTCTGGDLRQGQPSQATWKRLPFAYSGLRQGTCMLPDLLHYDLSDLESSRNGTNFRTFLMGPGGGGGESAKFSTKFHSPYFKERVFSNVACSDCGSQGLVRNETCKSWPLSLCPGEPALMNESREMPQLIRAYRAAGRGWEEWTAAQGEPSRFSWRPWSVAGWGPQPWRWMLGLVEGRSGSICHL